MQKYLKYVNALFLAAGALVWFVSQHYVGVAIGYFQLGRSLGGGAELLQHLLPLLLGAATFAILRRNHTTYNFAVDATAELTKTSWPTQKDVRLGTVVVIVTVIVAGLLLGMVDIAFTHIVRALLGA